MQNGKFLDTLFDRIFTDRRLFARAMADLIWSHIERAPRPIRRGVLKQSFTHPEIEEARERMERPLPLD